MKEMFRAASASIRAAVSAAREGRAILLHDGEGRENEVDIVFSAERCTPESIAFMRSSGGGLICAAIGNEVASAIGLPFMHDLLASAAERYPALSGIVEGSTPYGGRPAFSISLNHRDSYTGVNDRERSATVMAIGRVARLVSEGGDAASEFTSLLKAPGHVPLLIEAHGSLSERRGHTELSIAVMRMAGLPPASVVCEMLDSRTHRSLSVEDAAMLASDAGLPLLEGSELP